MGCLFRLSFYAALLAIAAWAYLTATRVPIPLEVDGSVDPEFEPVREKFAELLKDGYMKGSQFAVYYKNKLVIDLAGGFADREALRPMKHDSYVVTFSTIKSVFSLLTAFVLEQNKVDPSEKVSKFWPEFAQNGKENVTIANLLLHQGGVCGLDRFITLDDAETNNAKYQSILAEQKPLAPINERPYYHSWTYGMYLDQLVRRIDPKKRGMRQLLLEEVTPRCGSLDVHFGVPRELFYRLARFYTAEIDVLREADSLFTFVYALGLIFGVQWNQQIRNDGPTNGTPLKWAQYAGFISDFVNFNQFGDPDKANKFVVSAGGSFAKASDLARLYHTLVNGGFCPSTTDASKRDDTNRVVSSETIKQWTQIRYSGPDGLLPANRNRTYYGWVLEGPQKNPQFGSPGYGGQSAYADEKYEMSYVYFTNFMKPALANSYATKQLLSVTYQVIDRLRNNAPK